MGLTLHGDIIEQIPARLVVNRLQNNTKLVPGWFSRICTVRDFTTSYSGSHTNAGIDTGLLVANSSGGEIRHVSVL